MKREEHEVNELTPSIEFGTTSRHLPCDEECVYKGKGVSPGITIGPVYLYARNKQEVFQLKLEDGRVEAEITRFKNAVQRSERDLNKIIAVTRDKLGEDSAAIFEAQVMMLGDDALYKAVIDFITWEQCNADYAVQDVMSKHRQLMEASDSEYLRERANDLLDLQDRIIRHLRRGKIISAIDSNSIVVSQELTAADMILFSRKGVLGCATDFGGPTSHVSIMARALGVPAVVSMHGITDHVKTGDTVILDGIRGRIITHPRKETIEMYETRRVRYHRLLQEEKHLVPLPSETLDGHHVGLEANLELEQEVPLLKEYGAEGVGLFRTEMLFMMKGQFSITEEEQYRVYKNVVEAVRPGTTTFRVLDLGGDKMLPLGHREHNPFLGWRGLRLLLDKPELLIPQLRAILRASALGSARILLPMVSILDELLQFNIILKSVQAELDAEGISYDHRIPVGVMVEVPATALLAEQFAAHTDFFSIGSNDLTQYVLAVDRGNDMVADLYQDMHPAVLMLIKKTVEAAHSFQIPVSLCGELATNLRAVPVLIGLGLDTLSASPVYLPGIKRVVRAMKRSEGVALANEAIKVHNADQVTEKLDRWLDEHACGVSFFLEPENQQNSIW